MEELQKRHAELKKELALIESQMYDCYKDRIAPRYSNLPLIMTMCTPTEREQLARRCKDKIVDGKWTGCMIKGRPVVGMQTQRGREEQDAGTRKKRRIKGVETYGGLNFFAYHVLLVDAGDYPTPERNYCSHVCHTKGCLNVLHIVWSSSSDNQRRERMCQPIKECRCGLVPGCIFNAH